MVENEQNQDKKPYKQMSADEVYEKTKRETGKGVAAAAGSVAGFSESMEKRQVAEAAKGAIQKTGETTRAVAGTAADELAKTKERLASGASPIAEAEQDE